MTLFIHSGVGPKTIFGSCHSQGPLNFSVDTNIKHSPTCIKLTVYIPLHLPHHSQLLLLWNTDLFIAFMGPDVNVDQVLKIEI